MGQLCCHICGRDHGPGDRCGHKNTGSTGGEIVVAGFQMCLWTSGWDPPVNKERGPRGCRQALGPAGQRDTERGQGPGPAVRLQGRASARLRRVLSPELPGPRLSHGAPPLPAQRPAVSSSGGNVLSPEAVSPAVTATARLRWPHLCWTPSCGPGRVWEPQAPRAGGQERPLPLLCCLCPPRLPTRP